MSSAWYFAGEVILPKMRDAGFYLREFVLNYRHPDSLRVWEGGPSRPSCHHFITSRGSRGSGGSRGSRICVPKSSDLLLFTVLGSSWPPPKPPPVLGIPWEPREGLEELWESSGKPYIDRNSRSTAPADVMLFPK